METELSQLLYNKEQAAKILGLPKVSSINWLVRKGTLPHRKVAGKIRFTHSDLLDFVESVKVQTL